MKTIFTTHLRFFAMVGSFVLVSLIAGCSGGGGGGTTAPATFDGVVFRGDLEASSIDELFYTEFGSTTATKISMSLTAPSIGVTAFSISPNRRYVAYLADPTTSGVYELYVVHAGFNTSIKVSDASLINVRSFEWAPDSSRVAYIGSSAGVIDNLYSVQPDGLDHIPVNGALVAGGNVQYQSFSWAPDSSLIAYLANQDTLTENELYTATPRGALNTKINDVLAVNGDVLSFAWAPDSSLIAYIADQDTDAMDELYTATPGVTVGASVNDTLLADRDVFSFTWAPDSSRIAYLADHQTDDVNELYTVEPDGSSPTKQNNSIQTTSITKFAWSHDSTLLAFVADKPLVDGSGELYTSVPGVAADVRVTPDFIAADEVLSFAWSPDDSLLAYRAVYSVSSTSDELYTAPPSGGTFEQVNEGPSVFGIGNNVGNNYWSPDSTHLLYIADYPDGNTNQLYNGEADGTGTTLLNPSFSTTPLRNVSTDGFAWTPDGTQVVYVADQDVDGQAELYIVDPVGLINTKISGLNLVGGDVSAFMIGDSTGVSDFITATFL